MLGWEDRPTQAAQISALAEAEAARAIELLALAFRDNALNRAVIDSNDPERRLNSNRYGMRSLLPAAMEFGRVLAARSGGVVCGTLVSSPPGRFPLPAAPWWQQVRSLAGQGWRVARRWGLVFEALQQLHPIEPHWYLGTLGVDPSHQRQGMGAALLEDWLIEVDRSGVLAYLETDDESNVGFYGRAGFRVENETRILGVSIWCMRRPAPRT